MTSAIRTSALISPVFTCEMASASRRTCNIRCFTQLFVVNMIARPIWAKDVKFGVRCFCLGYLRPLLYRDTLSISQLFVYFFDERPLFADFLLDRRSERLSRPLVLEIRVIRQND